MSWHIKETNKVSKFIKGLSAKESAKVRWVFDLLEEFGPELGMPFVKHIRGRLYEIRVFSLRSLRFFFFVHGDNLVIIIHAFIKKSQKTPDKEINKAENIMNQVLEGLS